MGYKVELLMGNTYQVISENAYDRTFLHMKYPDEYQDTVEYQGSLADCEAWIRLHEEGYM